MADERRAAHRRQIDVEVNERLAVLEQQFEGLDGDVQALTKAVTDLTNDLTRYKGFVGGVVFIITCLWAMVGLFAGSLRKVFGG